jgi:hypothetical protein
MHRLDIAWADPLSAQLAIMVSAGQLLPIGTCPAVGPEHQPLTRPGASPP